jgi:hypothetical protein
VARKLYTELLACELIDPVGQSDPMFVDFLTETAEFCVRAFKAIPPQFFVYLVRERALENFVQQIAILNQNTIPGKQDWTDTQIK